MVMRLEIVDTIVADRAFIKEYCQVVIERKQLCSKLSKYILAADCQHFGWDFILYSQFSLI